MRVDAEALLRRIRLDAKDRLQQAEDRPRGPGAGYVGAVVLHAEGLRHAPDPRVQLGYPVAAEAAGGLGDVAGHACGLRGETVALHEERDDAVVVRPHRSELVGERVVGW